MEAHEQTHYAVIPAGYTKSEFPLQYYFEIRKTKSEASLYPGLGDDLTSQPYFVLRRLS
jgi:hypothetical protein